jgi:hypothetical protein
VLDQSKFEQLFTHYEALLKIEAQEFGVKPTEVRHLIGRLGELYCLKHTGGKFAHHVNQHGFDVVAPNGRRISVKTTAQHSGFVAISQSTSHLADDLMLLQYIEGNIQVLYYGPMTKAIAVSRIYEGKYEFDIKKSQSINAIQ